MTSWLVPVLWLCGPPGVGKSTVAFQLFTELSQAGVQVAFADTDQLGMCFPAPPEDPDCHHVKADNVGELILNYAAAGAQCVILAGSIDPAAGVRREVMPEADVTAVRLLADRPEVVRRFLARDEQWEDLDQIIEQVGDEAEGMDRSDFADACVETTGVAVGEVAGLVRDSCPDWPGFSGALAQQGWPTGPDAYSQVITDGDILLICGPTGVGKSTIGFRLYMQYLNAGLSAGYVDLDQIAFISVARLDDPGCHRLRARNLAAMWRNYHAAGATHLIATGPVESSAALQAYTDTLPRATVTLCRLHAGPDELTRRVLSRGPGGSWPQPGDPLRGKSEEYLRTVAGQAAAADSAFERDRVGALRIDTDGKTPEESTSLIAALTGLSQRANH